MEFVPGQRESLAEETAPGLVIVRSITKLLGIPGLKAGYLFAPPDLAALIRSRRSRWAVNSLALTALGEWATRPDAGAEIAGRIASRRRDLVARLEEISGVDVYPAHANFVLVRVLDGSRTASQLAEMGYAVRPASSFPGLTSRDLRITVRCASANNRLAAALALAVQTSG